MFDRDVLLSLIAEEKESFSQYCQLCSQYLIPEDPLATARHQGRMEILETLLRQAKISTKI